MNEKIYKLSEKLHEVSRSLELAFVYQLALIVLFVKYLSVHIGENDTIKVFDFEFNLKIFLVLFPIMLLYFLSKMALLTMIFIEFSELYYSEVENQENKAEDQSYYRAFRPSSIFLSIALSKNTIQNRRLSKFFHHTITSVIYIFPGISMAIVIFSILKYQNFWVATFSMVLAVIVFVGLFYEYYMGVYTRKYKYIIWTTFISMLISLVIFFYKLA